MNEFPSTPAPFDYEQDSSWAVILQDPRATIRYDSPGVQSQCHAPGEQNIGCLAKPNQRSGDFEVGIRYEHSSLFLGSEDRYTAYESWYREEKLNYTQC